VPRSYFPYDLEAYANEAMLSWMNQYRNKYNETAYQEQISRYLDDAADTLTFLSNTAFPDPKLDLCRSLYPELVREREAEEVEDSAGRTRSTEVKRTRRDAQAPLPGTSSSSAGRSDPDGDGQIVVNRPPSGANRMYGSRKNPATYPSTTNATALAAWPWFVRKIFGGGGRVEESPREEQSSGDLGGERVDLEQPDTNEDDMAGDSSDEVGSDSSRARSSLHAAAVSRTRTRTSTSTSTTSLPKIHDPNYTPTEKWCREQLFPRQEDDEGSDGYGGSSLTSRWGRTMVKGGMGRRRVTLQETVSLSLLFAVGLTVWLWVACCTTYFTQVPVHALKHPEKGTNQKRRPKAVRRRIIVED